MSAVNNDMLEQATGCQDIEKCLDFLEDYSLTTYQSRCVNYQKIQCSFYEQLQITEPVARRLLEVCIHDLNEDMKYASIVLAIIAQVLKKIKETQCPMVPELVQSALAVLHIIKTTSLISKVQALQRMSFETFLSYPDETYKALVTNHCSEVIELFNLYLHQGVPVFLRIMVFQAIDLFLNTLSPEEKSVFVRAGLNVWLGKVIPATMTLLVSSRSPETSIALDILDILAAELEHIDYSENPHWMVIIDCIYSPQKYPTVMKSLLESGDERWYRIWILLVKLLKQQITMIKPKLGSPINSMLPVVEAAFKVDVVNRCHAFKCWSVLIDNFSAETNENFVNKRIKLLIIPLKSNNAKVVETAMAKFDTWWHMIRKFESRLHRHFDVIFIPFLQFCFGNPKHAAENNVLVSGQLSMQLKKKSVQALVESAGHIGCTGCLPDGFPKLTQGVLGPKVLQDSLAQWLLALKMTIKTCGSAEYNIDEGKKQMSCIWKSFLYIVSRLQVDAKKDVLEKLLGMVTALVEECPNQSGVLDIVFDVLLKIFLEEPQTRRMLGSVKESQTDFGGFTLQIFDLIKNPILINCFSSMDAAKAVSKLTPFTNAILDDVLGPPSASLELMLHQMPANSVGPLLWTALMKSVRQIHMELSKDVLNKALIWPLNHIDLFKNAKYAALAWNKTYNLLRSKLQKSSMQTDIATILTNSNTAMCDLSKFALLHVVKNSYDRECMTTLTIDLPTFAFLVEKQNFVDCDCKEEIFRLTVDCSALMLSKVGEVVDATLAEFALNLTNYSLEMLAQNDDINGNDGCIIHAEKLLVQLKRIYKFIENSQLLTIPIGNLLESYNVIKKKSTKNIITNIIKAASSKKIDMPKVKDKFVAPETSIKAKKKEPSIIKTVVENGEEYVVVKSNWKFNPKKLTENQKEKFQKKREDIPALYQDLSQSQDEFKLRSWKTDSQDTSTTSSSTTNSINRAGNNDAVVMLKKMPSTEMVPKIMESIFLDKVANDMKPAADENVNSDTKSSGPVQTLSLAAVKPKSPRVALKDRVFQNVKMLLEKSNPGESLAASKNLNQTVVESVSKTPVSKAMIEPTVVFSAPPKISSERPTRVKRKPKKFESDFTELSLKRRRNSVSVNVSQKEQDSEMSDDSKCSSEASYDGKRQDVRINNAVELEETVEGTLKPEKANTLLNTIVGHCATHCDFIVSQELNSNENLDPTKPSDSDTLKPVMVVDDSKKLCSRKITHDIPKKDITIEEGALSQDAITSGALTKEANKYAKKLRKRIERIEKELTIDKVDRKEGRGELISSYSDTTKPVVVLEDFKAVSSRKHKQDSPKKHDAIQEEPPLNSTKDSVKTLTQEPTKSSTVSEQALDVFEGKKSRDNELMTSLNNYTSQPVVVIEAVSPRKNKQDSPKKCVTRQEEPPLNFVYMSPELATDKTKEIVKSFAKELRKHDMHMVEGNERRVNELITSSNSDTAIPVVILEDCKATSPRKINHDSPKKYVTAQEDHTFNCAHMSTEVTTNRTKASDKTFTKATRKSVIENELAIDLVGKGKAGEGKESHIIEPNKPSNGDTLKPVVVLDDCDVISPKKTNTSSPEKNKTQEKAPLIHSDMPDVPSNKAKDNAKPFAKKSRKSKIESELAIDMVEGHPLFTAKPEKRTRKSLVSVVCTRRKALGEKINKLPQSDSKLVIKSSKKQDSLKHKANEVVKDLFCAKNNQEDSSFSSNDLPESMSEDFIESSQDSTLTTISIKSGKKTPKAVLDNIQGLVKRSKRFQESRSVTDISTDVLTITPEDIEFSRNKSTEHDNTNKTVDLTADFDTELMDEKSLSSDDVIVINDEPVTSIEEVCISTQSQETADADTQPNDSKFLSTLNERAQQLQTIESTPDPERQYPLVIINSSDTPMDIQAVDVLPATTQDLAGDHNESCLSSPFNDEEQRNKDFLNNTLEISPIKSRSPIENDNKPQSPETSRDYVIVKLSSPVQSDGEPFEKSGSPEIFTEDKVSPDKRDLSPPREEVVVNSNSPNSSLSLKKNKPQMRQGGRAAQMLGLCVPERQNSMNTAAEKGAESEEPKKSALTPARRNLRMLYNCEPSDNNSDENEESEYFLKFKKKLPTADCSPAVPILKRKLIDIADDATVSPANKRKRVSFHDPPVSTTVSVHKYIEPLGIRSPQSSVTKKQERQLRNTSIRSPKKLENIFKLDTALTKTVESFIDPNSSIQSEDMTMSSLDQTLSVEIVKASELNDADPICPELINCRDAISIIAAELSSPAMKSLLIKELEDHIQTVGDLAKLTELEVNRLCIKAPKVKIAKKVLSDYAAKQMIESQVMKEVEQPPIETEPTDIFQTTVDIISVVHMEVQTDEASLKEVEIQTDSPSVATVITQTEKTETSSCMVQTNETGSKTTKDIISECLEKSDFVEELGHLLDEASNKKVLDALLSNMLSKKARGPSDYKMVIDSVLKEQEIVETNAGNDAFLQSYLVNRYEANDLMLFCSQLLRKAHDKTA